MWLRLSTHRDSHICAHAGTHTCAHPPPTHTPTHPHTRVRHVNTHTHSCMQSCSINRFLGSAELTEAVLGAAGQGWVCRRLLPRALLTRHSCQTQAPQRRPSDRGLTSGRTGCFQRPPWCPVAGGTLSFPIQALFSFERSSHG